MRRTRNRLALLALAALAGPAAAAAQDDAVFGELMDVELVLVDVLVEDREGRALLDLSRDDFRVFEDGNPVQISQFSPPAGPGPAAGASYSAETDPGEAAAQGAKVVLFLDQVHLGPLSRRRVLEDLSELLRRDLRPSDEAMVVGYDGSVRVLLPMTRDRAALRKVLKEQLEFGVVSLLSGFGEERALELIASRHRDNNQEGRFLGDPCVDTGFIARTHAEQVHARIQQTIGELERFVNSLAGYPGPKALLHVSDGIPLLPGATVYRHAMEMCDGSAFRQGIEDAVDTSQFGSGKFTRWDPTKAVSEMQEFDTSDEWTRLAAQANTYQVSFYTLQASPGALNRSSAVDGARVSPETEMIGRRNDQDALFLLADETGGRSMLGGGDFEPGVRRMLDERRLTYQLAYAPPTPGDGKQHRIRVQVDRPGVELRFRRGYKSKTAHERVADGVLSSLMHQRQANPLGVRVEIASQEPSEDGKVTRVRIRIRLPLSALVLLPEGEGARGLFTVFVAARDELGRLTPVGQKSVPVRVAPGDEEREFVYEVEIPLLGREPVVAVGLRDEIGGEASYLRKEVRLTHTS